MRVVIMNSKTEEFYTKEGKWTRERDRATTFKNSIDALEECRGKKIPNSEIVLSFRDPEMDIKIPCGK
jgi:hypothetical protein